MVPGFGALDRWMWIVFIIVTLANVAIYRSRAKASIKKDPELEVGYRQIAKGLAIWGNIPWAVMGIGSLVGGVTMPQFFRPADGDPFVLAFFASVLFLWILGTHWLVAKDGAELLARHPGLLGDQVTSARAVKIYWSIGLAAGVIAFLGLAAKSFVVLE